MKVFKEQFRSVHSVMLGWAWCLLLAPHVLAQNLGQSPPEVGEVTLQIGRASLERESAVKSIALGAKIRVGDVLKTAESGHVHIRFLDGALISLRPASTLKVEAYRFSPSSPADSVVRFTLVTGSVRAISGQAADAAKERFRLNTPLVAIGVRGTDFVTRVQDNVVAALVNQGAIVFAPLDASCRADALGPCAGDRAKLLTAEMSALVEFASNQMSPIFKPLEALKGKDVMPPSLPEESSSTLKRSQNGADAAAGSVVQALPTSPSASVPLAWGRWTAMALFGNLEVSPVAEAAKDRKPLIGTTNFGLFRFEASPVSFSQESGSHTFRLQSSAANFVAVSTQALMSAGISEGSLSIDFRNRSFGTRLELESASGLRSTLLGLGHVDSQGMFLMNAPDARVLGAVSAGAKGAGYTFERTVQGQGTFHGVTLWGK